MAKSKAYSKQSVKKTGRERKEKLVAELVEKLDSSNGLVFTEYKGITHQQLESLRRELKAVDSSLLIAKNSLMKIGLGKSKSYADFKDNENITGSSATLFIGQETIEPLKKLQKSIKDTGLPSIKFGILEGQLLDEAGIVKLASLPNREVLLAQLVGMLNAPIQGFVSGLNAIPQKFVMTLNAIASAKPAEKVVTEEPSTPAEPTPTETPVSQEPEKEVSEEKIESTAEVSTEEKEVETPAEDSKEDTNETDEAAAEASAPTADGTTRETNEKNDKGGEKTN